MTGPVLAAVRTHARLHRRCCPQVFGGPGFWPRRWGTWPGWKHLADPRGLAVALRPADLAQGFLDVGCSDLEEGWQP